MKKFYFLFLFALIASIGNLYAAEKTVTTTFTDNDLAVGAGEPEWESSIAATAFETSGSKRGVQFGAAKGIFTLKTKVSFSKVKNVSVLLSSNGNGNTVSLKVGVASVGKKVSIVKKNNYSVEWTAESPQDGIVELSFNDAAKSIYIKSISITYEEAAETKCAQPTFNLTADATYTDVQDLVITSTTEGAQIEYKIEGDKLTAPITGKQASPATVHLTANDTYMVTATATKEGLDASGQAKLMFTIAKKMNKPTFNLTEGTVYGEAKVLEITSDKVGAQIKYTIVGGGNLDITKTEASPVNVTLDQNGDYTVEAFALGMDDYAKSDAAGLNFRIELAAGVPTFSVEEGTYSEAQTITLTPGEGGAQVFYTINGGTEQPFIEPIKLEEDGTYKIAAYTAGTETLAKSATVTKTYVINLPLEEPYILCEDAAWLTEGANIIFASSVAAGEQKAMSKLQKTNNRGAASVTIGSAFNAGKETVGIVSKDADVAVFTVGISNGHITFYTGDSRDAKNNSVAGYLYAASSKDNQLKTQKNVDDNAEWTVSVAANGAATIKAQGNNTHNWMRYNPNNGAMFSCYTGGQNPIYIYLLGKTSSVSSMSAEGVKVFAAEGGVEVVADEATDVAVYTAAGQLVRQARVAEGSTLVNVAPGFYVVRANGTATKVIVR
uniref:chitobiase/beta-hexosaminidase C-terminal domain-containing protein n=1 Tax=Candidatus Limisoma sp. TaxID=3076476 RepID=UPI00402570ED